MSSILNKFLVRPRGDEVAIYNLPIGARTRGEGPMPGFPVAAPLTCEEAINMAAWLVSVAGHVDPDARRRLDEMLDVIAAEEADG